MGSDGGKPERLVRIHPSRPFLPCDVKRAAYGGGVGRKTSGQKRICVVYSGRVQGVGFRFTTESTALSLNLTGWVKNLADGCVEVVCEGEEAKLVQFLEKMGQGPMKPYIHGMKTDWSEASGEFRDFTIRF